MPPAPRPLAMNASIVVPFPGVDSTSNRPPTISSRSLMPSNPRRLLPRASKSTLHLKRFAVVRDLHANAIRALLDTHVDAAGLRMTPHVGVDGLRQRRAAFHAATRGFPQGNDRRRKELPRPFDQRGPLPGGMTREQLRNDGLFVELGEFQHRQSGRQDLTAQAPHRLEAFPVVGGEVGAQRRLVAARPGQELAVHAVQICGRPGARRSRMLPPPVACRRCHS